MKKSSRLHEAGSAPTRTIGWRLVQGALLLSCSMAAGGVQAAISQQSLIVKDPGIVEPNILFTLDDSGSMAYNYLPDSELADHTLLFHPSEPDSDDYVYYTEGIAATSDTNVLGARRRAYKVNTLYYNPEVLYEPWVKPDGTRMDKANPKSAIFHVDFKGRPGTERAAANKRIRDLRVDLTGVIEKKDIKKGLPICQEVRPGWVGQHGMIRCKEDTSEQRIIPGTYYEFHWPGEKAVPPTPPTEADKSNIANYTRVSIREKTEFLRGSKREDCTKISDEVRRCSREQEFQNFANWYQYHRTRMHVAVAAVGAAFSEMPDHVRVGYGRINKLTASDIDGRQQRVIEKGVRRFDAKTRKEFLTWLNGSVAHGSTPLVHAMDHVGRYYKRTDERGPWGNDPGGAKGAGMLSCRRSYHVLMTDGMYNFGSTAVGYRKEDFTLESDSSAGPVIQGTEGRSYQYKPEAPYRSGASGTLADYAMDLWKNDLQPNLTNDVPTDHTNPAFWQHVNTYTLSFGVSGTLDPERDLNALKSGAKSWPNPIQLGRGDTIDDLWHAALNSRGEYVDVQEGAGFMSRIQQILGAITGRIGNTTGVTVSSQSLQAGNTKFVPSFITRQWTGDLDAYELDANGKQQGLLWTASKMLPEPGSRNLYVGTHGVSNASGASVPFSWKSLPKEIQNQMLTESGRTAAHGELLVNYLRGSQTEEGSLFRRRRTAIGHIVNSPPVYIGAAIDRGYRFLPANLGENRPTGATSYRRYVQSKQAGTQRRGLVFVGSNDGILHAFDATTGKEVYGFIPRAVVGEMARSSKFDFHQRYLVDGPMVERDAYWDGAWRNVLVGTTGAGPQSVFALDVTQTKDANLKNRVVLWELETSDQPELGHVLAAPEVGVTRDGKWVAVFGNGYESRSGRAQLFVVDLKTGEVLARIDTGSGSAKQPNGLGGVTLVRDGTQMITAAYAGDLHGNVWKFDLADKDPKSWKVGLGKRALFQTKNRRPVTAAPVTVSHPAGGLMVLVGTGKLFDEGDDKTTDEESIYGLWDKERLQIDAEGNHAWVNGAPIQDSQIKTHRVNTQSNGDFATITSVSIDWLKDRGWRVPLTMLVEKGQRLIVPPQMVTGMALFETMSPVLNETEQDNACKARLVTPAFNLLLDPLTGAMPKSQVIDTDRNSLINQYDQIVAGWRLEDWTGRSVILTQAPAAPCTSSPCTNVPAPNSPCLPGQLVNNVQNVGQSYNMCVDVPGASRWWWREINVPDRTYEAGQLVPAVQSEE